MSERVVLLDEDGNDIGTADKREVHSQRTPLHLAFSCYVFDARGRFLLTQRARSKHTWPGVWTNSLCGHPAPGEDLVEAVRRRATQELGLTLGDVRLALPAFRYQAVMADGVRENEMCPVFVAVAAGPLELDPDEVDDSSWEDWAQFRADVLAGRRQVSPWCVQQVAQLSEGEPYGDDLPEADWDELPPAAR